MANKSSTDKKTLITVIAVVVSIILVLAIVLAVILIGPRDNNDGIQSDGTQGIGGSENNENGDTDFPLGSEDGIELPIIPIT